MTKFPILTTAFFILACASPVAADDPKGGPSEQQKQLLQALTTKFFEFNLSGDYASQYTMFSLPLAEMLSFQRYEQLQSDIVQRTDTPVKLNPVEISWYPNENLFAAVDFAGKSDTKPVVVCGYLVWEFASEIEVGLARVEQNIVDLTLLAEVAADKRIDYLQEFRCNALVMRSILALSN